MRALIPVSLLCIWIGLDGCYSFRQPRKEVSDFFSENHQVATFNSYKVGFRTFNYVAVGDSTKPLVVFVHGSPGSLNDFKHFLIDSTLTQNFYMITVDRAGFGYSNFGYAEPSLELQASYLVPLVKKYKKDKPVLLVGHSLGVPVIGAFAMDYPYLVDGMVFVAGSIDPNLEPEETWFRAPLATPFLSWMLPRALRASNDEIYQLKPQLELLKSRWQEITQPITIIQGQADELVHPDNTQFACHMMPTAPITIIEKSGMNHFVPWSDPHLIKDAILMFWQ